jgi:hypothetical protein
LQVYGKAISKSEQGLSHPASTTMGISHPTSRPYQGILHAVDLLMGLVIILILISLPMNADYNSRPARL